MLARSGHDEDWASTGRAEAADDDMDILDATAGRLGRAVEAGVLLARLDGERSPRIRAIRNPLGRPVRLRRADGTIEQGDPACWWAMAVDPWDRLVGEVRLLTDDDLRRWRQVPDDEPASPGAGIAWPVPARPAPMTSPAAGSPRAGRLDVVRDVLGRLPGRRD